MKTLEILSRGRDHLEDAVREKPDCNICRAGIATYHASHPNGDPEAGLEAVSQASIHFHGNLVHVRLLINAGRLEEAVDVANQVLATSHNVELVHQMRALIRPIRRQLLYGPS